MKSVCLAIFLTIFAATCAHADPRADVQQAFGQVLAAGGFRGYAQGHVFGSDLPAMAGEVDVIFPDRIHARTDEMEFIVLPRGAWLNVLGVWTPADRSLLPATGFDPAAVRQAIASIRDARIDGTSKTKQCNAQIYRFHASGKLPGASGDGDFRAWLCDGNLRPARLEATDALTGEKVIFDFDWAHRPVVAAPN